MSTTLCSTGSLSAYCPHYDAAIRFNVAGDGFEAVSSEESGRALQVYARDGEIIEEDIPCRRLEESGPSRTVST